MKNMNNQEIKDLLQEIKDLLSSKENVQKHLRLIMLPKAHITADMVSKKSDYEGIRLVLAIVGNGWIVKNKIADILQMMNAYDRAWEIAAANTESDAEIRTLVEAMDEMEPGEEHTDIGIYIMTTKDKFYGAAAISNKKLLREFAEKHHTDKIVMIPSSVHEVLLSPDATDYDLDEWSNLVQDVNSSNVEPEERLSNHAYYAVF